MHFFNKHDGICCPNAEYETLDIDPNYNIYGSKVKHTVIDFLNYEPEYKFKNIILFGVLGIINGCGGDSYTLHKNEENVINHINNLLEINGTVLLGPDVNKDSCGDNNYSNENYWNTLITTNSILKTYQIDTNFKGKNNMIIILRKLF